MVGKSKSRTKSQQRRFDALKEMGCICCLKRGLGPTPPEIHHIVDGYRKGHDDTLPLCPWHHRGMHDLGASMAEAFAGPSLALSKREFVREFGTEKALLEEADERLKKEGAI